MIVCTRQSLHTDRPPSCWPPAFAVFPWTGPTLPGPPLSPLQDATQRPPSRGGGEAFCGRSYPAYRLEAGVHSFIDSLVQSLIPWFIHLFPRSLIYIFLHPFIQPLIFSFVNSLTHSFIQSLIFSLVYNPIMSITRSFTHPLTPSPLI